MDSSFRGFSSSSNGMKSGNGNISVFSDIIYENGVVNNNFKQLPYPLPDPNSNTVTPHSNLTREEDSPEDCDFSDAVLKYINQILMEEDMEDKTCMLQDSLELQAAEKSFYEVLGKRYPPPDPYQNQSFISNCSSYNNSISSLDDNACIQNQSYNSSSILPKSSLSQSSYRSNNSVITTMDGLLDSPRSTFQISDWDNENQPISQFLKGVEEASKFLPNGGDFFCNIEVNGVFSKETKFGSGEVTIKDNIKEKGECLSSLLKVRKNPYREDGDIEEGRSSKQPAVYVESDMEPHVFDRMVLYSAGEGRKDFSDLCEALKNSKLKNDLNMQLKGPNGRKPRRKKPNGRKEVVDLRTLLINCAQAVAADDRRNANELMKQIRQHSSPFGDGNQRLAHCFADALEARLAGTGSQIYKGLLSQKRSAADVLKAYHLYLAACPFNRLSNFVSNKTIKKVSANSTRLHIIDFGILYGFQWPTLIQRLSWREGGPLSVRITGIDFPQPGFRPAERVEETGRRLKTYAQKFNVPFEYNAIAKRWETIKLEELKIDREEVIVVTCFYRGKNLLDETVVVYSPKDVVLGLVKKINPDIFIHGVTNGAYNAPFFVTRFREALFQFSSLFDMFDTVVPREDKERKLIEKEIFGREALNVVACEGWERVERPETYKQWQVRSLKAGLVQLSFDKETVQQATNKMRKLYHKDFLVDTDGQWLLQGWKGRILNALSVWKPMQKA